MQKPYMITYKQRTSDTSYEYSSTITENYPNRRIALMRYLSILDGAFPPFGKGSICELKIIRDGKDETCKMNKFIYEM